MRERETRDPQGPVSTLACARMRTNLNLWNSPPPFVIPAFKSVKKSHLLSRHSREGGNPELSFRTWPAQCLS